MRSQRGARGRFSSLYGTTTLRLGDDFPFPPGGPRYERLVFDADGQLIVALNEWFRLMHGGEPHERARRIWPCCDPGSAFWGSTASRGMHDLIPSVSTRGCF